MFDVALLGIVALDLRQQMPSPGNARHPLGNPNKDSTEATPGSFLRAISERDSDARGTSIF